MTDLLDLIEETETAARVAAVAAVATTCSCIGAGGEAFGFTSPRPGWWVHARCGLPTSAFVAAMVALEQEPVDVGPVQYWRITRDGVQAGSGALTGARAEQLRAAGWTLTPWTTRG